MARLLFISSDSDGKVNLREWNMKQNMSKNFIIQDEFELALHNWHAAGHKVEMDEWTGVTGETLIFAIRVNKGQYRILGADHEA